MGSESHDLAPLIGRLVLQGVHELVAAIELRVEEDLVGKATSQCRSSGSSFGKQQDLKRTQASQ